MYAAFSSFVCVNRGGLKNDKCGIHIAKVCPAAHSDSAVIFHFSLFNCYFAMDPLTGSDSQNADTPIVLRIPEFALCISPG
jgi:hypothetical protein